MTKFIFINPILVSIFPVLYFFSSNMDERVSVLQILSIIIISSLFATLTYLISLLLIKEKYKAILFSTWVILIFFSYGYLIESASEVSLFGIIIGSHRYLLPLVAIISLIIFFALKNSSIDFRKFYSPLLVFSLVLILINLIQIIRYESIPMSSLRTQSVNTNNFEANYNKKLPDVYHLIFDMYPSETILLERLGFDNSKFISQLENEGFNLYQGKSNYLRSRHSIPSTINMVHLIDLDNSEIKFAENTFKSFKTSNEAYLASNIGYDINVVTTNDPNLNLGWIIGDFFRVFVRTNMLRVIDDSPIPIHKLWINKESKFFKDNMKLLADIPLNEKPTWTFFYSRPPHPPFIFNPDGTLRSRENYDSDFPQDLTGTWDQNAKSRYIDQIKYVNDSIINLVNEIITKSKNEVIIIIHSDHGVKDLSGVIGDEELLDQSDKVLSEAFSVFLSFYSQNCNPKFSSNVNIIRSILRTCYDLEIDDIDNSSYWSPRNGTEFIKIPY